ncbi:MAG: DUF6817 domain-containing protein [Pseudomonadota bacterium]
MDDIDPRYLAVLNRYGTDTNPHTKGSLLSHLAGTYRLLQQWGNPQHVALAGLFHSIYGTQYYKVSSTGLSDREAIAAEIGKEAESLAHLFCATDRLGLFFELDKDSPHLWHMSEQRLLAVEPETVQELAEIEVANRVEQHSAAAVLAKDHVSHLRQMLERGRDYLTTGATESFERLLSDKAAAA